MQRRMRKLRLRPGIFERREVGDHTMYCLIFYIVAYAIPICTRSKMNGVIPYSRWCPGMKIVGRVKQVGAAVKKFKEGDLAGVGCLVDSCRTCDNCKEGAGAILPQWQLCHL